MEGCVWFKTLEEKKQLRKKLIVKTTLKLAKTSQGLRSFSSKRDTQMLTTHTLIRSSSFRHTTPSIQSKINIQIWQCILLTHYLFILNKTFCILDTLEALNNILFFQAMK